MNIKEYYFIPISSWNINSIFSTESISPHFFYSVRLFGISRNILTNDLERPLQFENCIVLYPKPFKFEPQKGNPIFIALKRNSLINDQYIIKDEILTYCLKTIYFRRDTFFICIPTEDIKTLILADASPSIEVKTINKYLWFRKKTSFLIIHERPELLNPFNAPEMYSPDQEILEKKSLSQPYFDKAFNHIKGFIYGYLGGTVGGKKDNQIELEKSFQSLQNEITGLKGRIEQAQEFHADLFDTFMLNLDSSKHLYKKIYPKNDVTKYNVVSDLVKELVILLQKRFLELDRQKAGITQLSSESKQIHCDEIKTLDIHRSGLKRELESIQNHIESLEIKRKACGRSSKSKDLKDSIKEQIGKLKIEKQKIKSEISVLTRSINAINFKITEVSTVGRTDYDGNIEDVYARITNLLADIQFLVHEDFITRKRNSQNINLNQFEFNHEKLTQYWLNRPRIGQKSTTEDYFNQSREDSKDILFTEIINTLLENNKCTIDVSENQINDIILSLINRFKIKQPQNTIVYELERLHDYRLTKSFEYVLPNDNVTLVNFIAFIFKPTSIEELERFLFTKNVTNHFYAFCFWGTFNGFASMPKTFTDTIFESEKNEKLLDEIDTYLFDRFLGSKE